MVGKLKVALLLAVVAAVAAAPVAGVGASTAASAAADGVQQTEAEACAYDELYDRTIDSVVQIELAEGVGSGFVYDVADDNATGYVVTNAHVVGDAATVGVRFARGETRSGSVVGSTGPADLAVVRVNETPDYVEPLPLANATPDPGQRVAALGSPFGLEATITSGIVSGVNRSSPTEFPIPNTIQTDAPINPGNSGGPLVACDTGAVLGVNQAGGGDNVGFAISASIVERIVPQLIQEGGYEYPYLGVQPVTLTQPLADANDLGVTEGVYVVEALNGTPAGDALQGATDTAVVNDQQVPVGGDVIVAVDGRTVETREGLLSYLFTETRPGETVELTIVRDGERQTVEVTLGERPEQNQG